MLKQFFSDLRNVREGERKIIALDVDSVLLNMEDVFISFINEKYETLVSKDDLIHWSLKLSFGIPEKVEEELWKEVYGTSLEPEEGAKEFVTLAQEMNYNVVAITARVPEGQEATRRDLRKHFPTLNGLHFSDGKVGKGVFAKAIRADIFVDDKIKNVKDVSSVMGKNTKTFLFDQPWNKSRDLEVPYERVYGFRDLSERI